MPPLRDVGKTAYPEEVSEPGHLQEDAGRRLLPEHGRAEKLARFRQADSRQNGGIFGAKSQPTGTLFRAGQTWEHWKSAAPIRQASTQFGRAPCWRSGRLEESPIV